MCLVHEDWRGVGKKGRILWIAQRLIRLSNLLELLRRFLVVWVLVRVVDDGEFAVRFLDVVLRRLFLHPEDLVVVFSLAFLQLELGVSDFFLESWFGRVGFGNGFVFSHGFFPVPGLAKRFRFCFARFGVCWVDFERTGAVRDGGFVVFQLLDRSVLASG